MVRWRLRGPADRLFAAAGLVCLSFLVACDSSSNAGAGSRAQSVEELIEFYEPRSMLFQADEYAWMVMGDEDQWNGPYMDPQPEEFTDEASVFLTIYPRSIVPAPGESVMGTLADSQLWDDLEELGFDLMHPVAFFEAGQVREREYMSSIDGGFDRISLQIEPQLGTEEDVRRLVEAASSRDALIAGDVIPLHTGLGPDFRLATMGYEEYPGIYDMIEIPEEDWDLLPAVDDPWDVQVITNDEAQPLIDAGYMPGRIGVLLADPEAVDWSGWAATGPVPGADGTTRRWIYAHLFKAGQPALNWMDPTYAGRRIQAGDVVRHVYDLGVRANRLDAVPFLGLDPVEDGGEMRSYNTQLAIEGTNDLAYTHRKLDGFSWVELNSPTGEYNEFMENGADLGYDFFTRAQTVHPLITGDARVLRIAHRSVMEGGVDHRRLIHAMQNHDEITYQLINLGSLEEVQLGDETISGSELQERIWSEMRSSVAGEAAPYNKLYRQEEDGVATTYAGFVAPALGIDPYGASDEEIERIKQGHLVIAIATAMQPGVFAISQWDLVGALPVPEESVADRTAEGDVRWVNRGAVDLLGASPGANQSPVGLPVADTLYGPLTRQMNDPDSFARRIGEIVQARKRYGISDAMLLGVPEVEPDSVLVLVMTLPPEIGGVAVTTVNYGQDPASFTVDLSGAISEAGGASGTPHDIIAEEDVGSLSGSELSLELEPLTGRTIVIGATPGGGGNGGTGGTGGTGGGTGGTGGGTGGTGGGTGGTGGGTGGTGGGM